ncbi:MAG TPA: hypothetical protein PLF03_05875 [Candidatus Omnitrophota bacterium]|nr:hypothetical protein [Candidatus Omnitrophota bacterium]
MRGVIKGVLAEELENSLRMKKEYEAALSGLPKGCLAIRRIRGHEYYYLVKRIDRKVKYIYKGKISEEEKKKYGEAKELRAKYKKLLAQVKKQIRFLRSSLRGKEAI